MSKSAVLFVSHEASRTGAPIYLLEFMRWFKKNRDVPFAIMCVRGGPLLSSFQELAPTIVPNLHKPYPGLSRYRGIRMKLRYHLEIRRIRSWALSQNVGLVYSNTIVNNSLYFIFSQLNCPIVTHAHELHYSYYYLSKSGADEIQAHTTRFIAASDAVVKCLTNEQGISPSLISLHHEAIPTSSWKYPIDSEARKISRMKLNLPDDRLVVLGSGTSDWRKGSDLFVRLAKVAQKRDLSAIFVWVGGSSDEIFRMKYDAEKLGVSQIMRWTGSVERPQDIFIAADVFVLTSREDPYPLVMLEAAALGLPVLCFESAGGAPEFVEQDCGFVVPYIDVEAMAERIAFLESNPDIRMKLGQRAAEKVRQRHDINVAAPKLADEIEQIINSSSKLPR